MHIKAVLLVRFEVSAQELVYTSQYYQDCDFVNNFPCCCTRTWK
jgi:hypothetical protein